MSGFLVGSNGGGWVVKGGERGRSTERERGKQAVTKRGEGGQGGGKVHRLCFLISLRFRLLMYVGTLV